MKHNRSLKAYLLRTAFVFSVLGFFLIYWAASQAYTNAVKSNAIAVSNQLALNTFNSMFQIMQQGWNRDQVETFIDNLQRTSSEHSYSIEVYRADRVTEKFGAIDQKAFDAFNRRTLETKSAHFAEEGATLRYSYPLLARAECLGCHSNAKPGELLGLIEVRQNLGPMLHHAQNDLVSRLIYLAPIPFLLAVVVIFFMNRRINHSIQHLEANIDRVHRVSDLKHLELQTTDLGFSELNRVYAKVEGLGDRMRDIAVDRELLEFEIRLLEKFVITSEVVRDWREYVNILLNDINTVMRAYNLFSIFKVDEEIFDLEIFWSGPPSDETRALMESEIKKALDASPLFRNLMTLSINHSIADRNGAVVDLQLEDVQLQTKSLFLEAPKIGGIVGIGVHVDISQDESRRLVMESILSTLMNVVGSVKAIYKYTKDLEYYATRDPLTDLHNQRIFWEMLNYEVMRAHRKDYNFGLLVVDLDNFKSINDSYGHSFGDKFLQELSRAMREALRAGDMLARYGGDEFTVILPEASVEQTQEVAQRLLRSLENLQLKAPSGDDLETGLSIGLANYPEHASSSKDLFMFADNMMYKAKALGKNRVYVPSEDDVIEVFKDISEKSLMISKAIKEKRVIPYFQPLMGNASGKIEAVEVLSRIQLEGDNVMGAHEFIEIAENMGVIHNLDFAVMEKAFSQVQKEGFDGLVFVNMSPRSLVLSEFVPEVKRIVAEAGIPPQRVVFEITERDTVKNMTMLEKFVQSLKAEGFNLAIDDFGSGFSSFHYLKHFPIDFVKIEGEFIANMVNDSKDNAVVRCITDLAHELKARTIAEYVESAEVLEAVKAINITYAQGFHIRRPAPYIYPPEERQQQTG
ncbi:bifunctional diguanylate cyclase/phosphodiesterase [Motiliproteus sp. SC1-56]|uniref:putative bifunctional diguanylate cyclase/phosphodiesterase n=1 Tax=Motiliproteus sp. SC1-56 TaxID=2799565 RepID=UPI001A8C8392|nr:bifunctional diguanylate cyclase/phosphodiesterase [Motiliproteus sp. SC1-56]